ncbi:hypothetical protein EB155_02870 [archaeon]|nr:hypothetical protein [archaeon]NDB78784.1 hypothetical protein [archaeon]
MALKFRRGSTADKSGSLAYGEPYVNTSLGTLQVGGASGDITLATVGDSSALNVLSVSASTFVSASTLHITSNAEIKGNLTLGGNITIGDQTSDTVAVNANLSSSLIPSITNTFDLGSSTKIWKDIYVSTGSIKFVDPGTNTVVGTLSSNANGDFKTSGELSGSTVAGLGTAAYYSASVNSRLDSIQTTTASLNGRVGALETKTASLDETFNTFSGSFNTYTASNNTTNNTQNSRLNAIETSTSSLNTHTASAEGRLTSLETTSGSLVSFSSSVASAIQFTGSNVTLKGDLLVKGTTTTINSTTVDIGDNIISLNGTGATNGGIIVRDATGGTTTSGSLFWDTTNDVWKAGAAGAEDKILLGQEFYIFTASNALTHDSHDGRLDSLENSSASINSFTASQTIAQNEQNVRLNTIENTTGSLNTYTASNNTTNNTQNTRLTALENASGSLNSYTASQDSRNTALFTATSSLNSYTASNNTNISAIHTSTSSLNSYTASNTANINAIHTSTSSLNTFTSSINTTIKSKLDAENVISGSSQVTISNTTGYSGFSSSIAAIPNALSSSVAVTNASQDTRLNSIEGVSGSYATTGSNIFQGNQIITGSLYISQDLVVAGSSSIQNISSSELNVGTNIVKVNALNPSIRFGGLSVIDSGSSPQVSGSILFDSVNDQWIYVHQAVVGAAITSSVLLMGPQTYNSLGSELYPTTNRLVKSINAEHLGDSNITDTGTKVSINSNLEITGSVISTTSTLISSSAQITSLPSVDTDDLTEGTTNKYYLDSRVKTKLSAEGVISGSSQVYSGVSGDVVIASNGVATIQANSVALGSDTTGDYVASLVAGTNITLTNNSGEGATPTIALTNNSITIAGQSTSLGGTITAATIGNAIGAFSGSSQVLHDSTTGFDSNKHIDHTAVSISAGLGLSGGGTIAATRTLSIDTAITATVTGSQTLTNKTIAAGSNTISGLTNSNLSGTAGISNANLANSSVTVTAGTGMSGGGTVALGSSITLTNAGVTSNVAGTGVSVSGATGAVTISIGQAVATSSNVQFNSLGVGMAASATAGRIDATNDIVAYSSSDRRFKNNIKAIEKPLDKINKISGNTFDWNEENKIEHGYEGNDVGVIAQEIEEVLPQLVQTRENGYKAVKYDKLVALLIEGIKEQQIQINDMKVEIENLKRQKGL